MKIKLLHSILFGLLFLFPAVCQAQLTVVRVDGKKVYIDTSSLNRIVQKGETFKIILSTEELKNPKTGKNLGTVYNYSSEGKITEVQPLYAIGELPGEAVVSVGQEAVLEEKTAAQPAAKDAPSKAKNSLRKEYPVSLRKKITYAPVEQQIISLTEADISSAKANNLVTLSKKGQVTVWNRVGENLEPLFSYQLPSGKIPLTLSADDVRDLALDEIFVTAYDPSRQTISTWVLAVQNGQLSLIDTLPYFVKEIGCGPDKEIFAQKPFVSGIYPGKARELDYEKGKFRLDDEALNTRRNWLPGINHYDVEKDDSDNLVTTASNGKITLFLSRGRKAESKDLFAEAPNRVKYKQEIIKFYPSLQVFGPDGRATLVAVENIAKHGLLSDTFGDYENGNIHFLKLEKGRLTITDTVELDGVVYDTACSARSILAAEVLSDGTSSVVEISK